MARLGWVLVFASVISLGVSCCLLHIAMSYLEDDGIKLDLWRNGLGFLVLAVVFTLAGFIVV